MDDLDFNKAALERKKVEAEVRRKKLFIPIVVFVFLFIFGPVFGYLLMFGNIH